MSTTATAQGGREVGESAGERVGGTDDDDDL